MPSYLPKREIQLCPCKYSPRWLTFPLLGAHITLMVHRYIALNTQIHTHSQPHTCPHTKSHTSYASHTFYIQSNIPTKHAHTTHKSHIAVTGIVYLCWRYFQLQLLFCLKINPSSFWSLHSVFS